MSYIKMETKTIIHSLEVTEMSGSFIRLDGENDKCTGEVLVGLASKSSGSVKLQYSRCETGRVMA